MGLSNKLFLDDYRAPLDVFAFKHRVENRRLYLEGWHVVTSYDEFVKWIEKNGLPKIISFDHDLAEDQYTPSEYWNDFEASKKWQEDNPPKGETGLDCAKWLVGYCMQHGLELPEYYVHSMNPVGADNIKSYLENFKECQK